MDRLGSVWTTLCVPSFESYLAFGLLVRRHCCFTYTSQARMSCQRRKRAD
jgi:hypothetical protein